MYIIPTKFYDGKHNAHAADCTRPMTITVVVRVRSEGQAFGLCNMTAYARRTSGADGFD